MLIILVFIFALPRKFIKIDEPVYNLQNSSEYTVRRVTSDYKVPYFVKPDFTVENAGELKAIEIEVEVSLEELRRSCFREKSFSKYQRDI